MTYKELIAELKYLKMEGEILDYLIASDFSARGNKIYVKAQLTIFNSDGKPSIMTMLKQGEVDTSNITNLFEEALVEAYNQTVIGKEQSNIPFDI